VGKSNQNFTKISFSVIFHYICGGNKSLINGSYNWPIVLQSAVTLHFRYSQLQRPEIVSSSGLTLLYDFRFSMK
jgi:hypothetical protein